MRIKIRVYCLTLVPVPALIEPPELIPQNRQNLLKQIDINNVSSGAGQLHNSNHRLNVSPDIDLTSNRKPRRSKGLLETQKHRQINLLKGEQKPAYRGAD
jgi:hypothetical protein